MTKVVNLRKEPYDIYIGRGGKGYDGYFGNLFSVEQFGREKCLIMFKEYFYKRLGNDPVFKQKIHALKDKVLGCFCVPQPCHGHIIADYLNNLIDSGV